MFLVLSCLKTKEAKNPIPLRDELRFEEAEEFFETHPEFISNGFDFPVGAPNAQGYYDLQPFGKNFHLGEDWNAIGRNDYGDPVYAVSNGIVKFAGEEGPGWGNVLILTHRLPDGRWINSLYAHLSKMHVAKGDKIKKGKKIGKIGDANRRYGPHLHFEMREDFFLPTGPGYGKDRKGYLSPKEFIRKHRSLKTPRRSSRKTT
ncbi:M23 family metallopeptidase [Leptospira yasudae]|uniref:M23 family metallopeptidase n=1 Tax=Leptospira yasudae TaxID=2202201 RepID=A0A6N4QZM2_9LEPT|nr:peptidoglycan DD-metalloendopeptidase family protein [Leptospira yasudae]TGL77948.1 M23 family metallopeptidase [Leptospira yasudae]TGL81315.1 M23 family metallopeptidase [Leptospira yasudae]TGL82578.1 M23 family metallopeptidase [Leptospira yasudae]